jgi:hypothetical protein
MAMAIKHRVDHRVRTALIELVGRLVGQQRDGQPEQWRGRQIDPGSAMGWLMVFPPHQALAELHDPGGDHQGGDGADE